MGSSRSPAFMKVDDVIGLCACHSHFAGSRQNVKKYIPVVICSFGIVLMAIKTDGFLDSLLNIFCKCYMKVLI